MASPQIENGYTKIANELLEALARSSFRGEVWRVLMFVIRKTYGFNKVCDHISLSQFELGTGICHRNICRVLKEVVANRTLLKTENGYKLNKNYNQWIVANQPQGGGQTGNQVVAKLVKGSGELTTHKRNIQKKDTKGDLKKLEELKNFLEDKKIIKNL